MTERGDFMFGYGLTAVIGFCLALLFVGRDGSKGGGADQSGTSAGAATTGAAGQFPAAGPHTSRMGTPLERSRFRAAWNALPDQDLTKSERLDTQRRMLAEWARIDLAAAMDAALTVPWDNSSTMTGPVASLFSNVFQEDAERSWNLINSGRYGLGAAFYRNVWINNVSQSDPLLVVECMPEGSWRDRNRMIAQLHTFNAKDPQMLARIGDALRAQPDDIVTAAHLQKLVPQPSLEEIQEQAAKMEDFSSRDGQVLTSQLIKAQSERLKAQSDPAAVAAAVTEVMATLPHQGQGEFIYQVLSKSLAAEKSKTGGRQALAVVDLLVAGEHWDYLDDPYTQRKVSRAIGVPPVERAGWAVTLPDREETLTLFHQSVKEYVSQKPDEAWQWIEALPKGTWRDHAFGEFSLRATGKRKDYEGSRRAIDQIADPEYRAYIEQRRPDWAKEMDGE